MKAGEPSQIRVGNLRKFAKEPSQIREYVA